MVITQIGRKKLGGHHVCLGCIVRNTVKSHFKALGLYNFKRGFGWAYKWVGGGGLISGWDYKWNKSNVSERRDKTYLRNELKLTLHYILS